MSNILYNSNSKLISKYQRKSELLSTLVEEPNKRQDDAFHSVHPKDSREYLIDLCSSVYPQSLVESIATLNDWELSVQALIALILKNFVTPWYGSKIPSIDQELLILVYHISNKSLRFIANSGCDWTEIVGDDLPYILNNHFIVMSKVLEDDLCYMEFQKLYLYKGEYPGCIVQDLCGRIANDSILQKTFLNGLVGDLLLDKIVEKVVAPFILVDLLQSICDKLLQASDEHTQIQINSMTWAQRFQCLLRDGSHFISYLTSVFSSNSSQKPNNNKLYAHIYLFTFVRDATLLDRRKTIIYYLFKLVQSVIDRSAILNRMLYNLINNLLYQKVLRTDILIKISISLRHALFPNDSKMGPPKLEPSADEFLLQKAKCKESLWKVCNKYKLPELLAMDKNSMDNFIEALTRDVQMNKFFIYKLFEFLCCKLT